MYCPGSKTDNIRLHIEKHYPALFDAIGDNPEALEELADIIGKVGKVPQLAENIVLPKAILEQDEIAKWGLEPELVKFAHLCSSKPHTLDQEGILRTVGAYSIIQPMTLFEPVHVEFYDTVLKLSYHPSRDLRTINDGWVSKSRVSIEALRDMYASLGTERAFFSLQQLCAPKKNFCDEDPLLKDYPPARSTLELQFLKLYQQDPFAVPLTDLRKEFQHKLALLLNPSLASN